MSDSPLEVSFDRGTLLIEEGTARALRVLPGYFLWDSRVGGWRAPACHLGEFLDGLRAGGTRFVYRSPRPAGFLPARVDRSRLPPLRPYQEEALRAWSAAGRRGLVSLPTGSGKTRLAVTALLSLARPALVVAPTRELVRQWAATLARHYPHPIGLYADGEHELRPLTVATYQSAHIHLDLLGDHFDVLVADEVHHFSAQGVGEVAQMATAAWRLGLSGTLPETGKNLARLEALFGPVCFSLPIASLSGTYLAEVSLRVVPLRLEPDERRAYERLRSEFLRSWRPFAASHPDASWQEFTRAACRSPGGRAALSAFHASRKLLALPRAKLLALDHLIDLHRTEPTIVFTADNDSAYEVSRRFLVPALTCDIERGERKTVLEHFDQGVYRTIVSARCLNEGIDVPAASVAIVAGGSGSPVQHAQRIGRVLRPVPGKHAVVYELVVERTSDWTAAARRKPADVARSILAL
jgi:superfamily II DNA or RNA helicase